MSSLAYYSFTALVDSDTDGDNVVISQAVSVKTELDGVLATIYSDAAGTTPISQPGAVTDANGVLEFWALPGIYTVESGTRTETIRIINVDLPLQFDIITDMTGDKHARVGHVCTTKNNTSGTGTTRTWDVVLTSSVTPDAVDIIIGVADPLISFVGRDIVVLETDTTTADMAFVLDEDDMTSNSATKLATQQSIKAYVDGLNSSDIDNIRYNLISNPLFSGFTKNKIDSAISHTRAGGATYHDQYGQVKYSPSPTTENLCLQSEDFTTTWTSPSGGNATANTAVAPDGTLTADTMDGDGTAFATVEQAIVSSGRVTFSVFVKEKTSPYVYLAVQGTDVGGAAETFATVKFTFATRVFDDTSGGTAEIKEYQELADGWFRIAMTVDTTTVSKINIYNEWSGTAVSDVFVWGAQLEQSKVANGYQKTTTVAVNSTSYFGIDQTREGLIEGAATNEALYSRDLTNAVWVKTNCTAAQDATGRDGIIEASTLTATGASATCLQTVTKASAENTYSFDIRRKTGTGTIEYTDDNGSTYTDITSLINSSTYTRFERTTTQANPAFGFRITTSGDEIEVDFNQLETGNKATSRIITTSASVTRVAENVSAPLYNRIPNSPLSIYAKVDAMEAFTGSGRRILSMDETSGVFSIQARANDNDIRFNWYGASANNVDYAFTPGDVLDIFVVVDGTNISITVNGVTSSSAITDEPVLDLTGIIYIGSSNSYISNLNNKILRLETFDFALNSDEIKYIAGN